MNREDIIRMARESGFEVNFDIRAVIVEGVHINKELARFAALVAAAEAAKWAKGAKISVPTMTMEQEFTWHRNKGYEQGKALIPAAVAAEREACAEIAEETAVLYGLDNPDDYDKGCMDCAKAIRARGK